MNKERIKGSREQQMNSSRAIFNQARALFEAGTPVVSRDPRLSKALEILGLPGDLQTAVSVAKETEEKVRNVADKYHSWRPRYNRY